MILARLDHRATKSRGSRSCPQAQWSRDLVGACRSCDHPHPMLSEPAKGCRLRLPTKEGPRYARRVRKVRYPEREDYGMTREITGGITRGMTGRITGGITGGITRGIPRPPARSPFRRSNTTPTIPARADACSRRQPRAFNAARSSTERAVRAHCAAFRRRPPYEHPR